MLITDYTSPDEIRAALGVSFTELPDSVLSLTQYELLLTLDLEEVNTSVPAAYATISALLVGDRSLAQQRFYLLARLFATYAIARTLLTSLPLFAVERLTDGRAEFQRQADIYEDVRDGVKSMFNTASTRLAAAYLVLVPGATVPATSTFAYTSSTGLGVDPVTNT